MRKLTATFAAGVLTVVLTACSAASGPGGNAESSEAAVHTITAEEAKSMMEEGDVTVVDVRTAEEYAQGHVPDAINIPNEDIGEESPEALPQKDAILLIYCRSGRRSAQAAKKLAALGYENIYDFGGIIDWPYETE